MLKHSPFAGGAFRVSSPYGYRASLGDNHKGIDLVGLNGDKLICSVDGGKVVQSRMVTNHSNRTWEWGNYVAIKHSDGTTAYYCHLDNRLVGVGEEVSAGTRIGIMGSTGYSFGAHLHFEVRNWLNIAFDPAEYLGIPNVQGAVISADLTPADDVPVETEEPDDIDEPEIPEPAIDYATLVCNKCGLEQITKDYLNAYKYADDLWRKLYEQMM